MTLLQGGGDVRRAGPCRTKERLDTGLGSLNNYNHESQTYKEYSMSDTRKVKGKIMRFRPAKFSPEYHR